MELAVTHKMHLETVIGYRNRYLQETGRRETDHNFLQHMPEVGYIYFHVPLLKLFLFLDYVHSNRREWLVLRVSMVNFLLFFSASQKNAVTVWCRLVAFISCMAITINKSWFVCYRLKLIGSIYKKRYERMNQKICDPIIFPINVFLFLLRKN